jgi:carboxyl-terminal processing protease
MTSKIFGREIERARAGGEPSTGVLVVAALVATFGCGQPGSDGTSGPSGGPSGQATTAAAAAPPSSPSRAHVPDGDDEVPVEKFANGAKAFAEVRDALLKSYYAEGLSEDDVYRAATAGMLEKLEPRMQKYNRLLSPREIAEIKNDLKGEVVGVGVQISFDEKSGYTDVLGTIPRSPSEKAGLVAGDKIVTVNGKLYKGMRMTDVVADIRGKAGDPVTLSVLRGDKLVSFTIVRDKVPYDAAAQAMLPDQLGYVRIPSFTEKTPAAVRASLEELEKGGARGLVVDLRHSPGGSFEKAVETAELLLPEGSPIVILKGRGKGEETRVSKGKPILGNVPMAVLVDNGTSSGAEFLAGALQENRHARLVGARTHGKWSVQSLDDLPNGYAYKYTVSLFLTPSRKSYEGTGITPDIELSMDDATFARANAAKPEDRLAIDVQLKTAKQLILR